MLFFFNETKRVCFIGCLIQYQATNKRLPKKMIPHPHPTNGIKNLEREKSESVPT